MNNQKQQKMNKSVVLAYSGGMDSTVLLYKACSDFEKVYTVSFFYGQRHDKELDIIKTNISKFKNATNIVLNLKECFGRFGGSALLDNNIDVAKAKDVIGDPQTVNYIPNRNAIFLSILTGYAESVGSNLVWYGAAQADSLAGYFDGSVEFVDKINEVNQLNRRNVVKIEAPLLDLSKKQIIKLGGLHGVDFKDTWTCYEGKDIACGECTACALRIKGFIDAKVKDPIIYRQQEKLNQLYSNYK